VTEQNPRQAGVLFGNMIVQLMGVFESLPLTTTHVEQLAPPARDIGPEIHRPMIQAARARTRLEVDYVDYLVTIWNAQTETP